MKQIFLTPLLALLMLLSISASTIPAHAGIFDDSEARQAILDLRSRLTTLNEQLATKADKPVILEQINQMGALREEIAKLRGQVELLSNEISESQRRQKDFYADLDNRLRKLEPQKVVVDGKEAQIEQGEQKSYDAAVAAFQSGDYAGAAKALQVFIRTYPHSAYVPNALYSVGIVYYVQKNYKNAIASFQSLITAHAGNANAPDAMLNMASCYSEQKDNVSAKKILQKLRAEYPDSSAAKTALDRLNALK